MTTIGVLAAAILSSLLIVVLDMGVYRESFGMALHKQSLTYNSWQTYLFVIGAIIVALHRDWRSRRRSRGSKQHQRLNGARQSGRNKQ